MHILTNKEYERMSEEYNKIKIKCKCGHKVIVPMWVDRQICSCVAILFIE